MACNYCSTETPKAPFRLCSHDCVQVMPLRNQYLLLVEQINFQEDQLRVLDENHQIRREFFLPSQSVRPFVLDSRHLDHAVIVQPYQEIGILVGPLYDQVEFFEWDFSRLRLPNPFVFDPIDSVWDPKNRVWIISLKSKSNLLLVNEKKQAIGWLSLPFSSRMIPYSLALCGTDLFISDASSHLLYRWNRQSNQYSCFLLPDACQSLHLTSRRCLLMTTPERRKKPQCIYHIPIDDPEQYHLVWQGHEHNQSLRTSLDYDCLFLCFPHKRSIFVLQGKEEVTSLKNF